MEKFILKLFCDFSKLARDISKDGSKMEKFALIVALFGILSAFSLFMAFIFCIV